MSPSATRSSRASKPSAKPTGQKSSAPARSSTASSPKSGRTTAVSSSTQAKRKVPAPPPVPESETKKQVMKAAELKTKSIEAKAPEELETPTPKSRTVKAEGPKEPRKKIKAAEPPEVLEEEEVKAVVPEPPKRGRKPKSELPHADEEDEDEKTPSRGGRSKSFEPIIEEFLDDDVPGADDDAAIPEDLELDPLEIPLELLDPELVDVPRPSVPPKPKPKLPRSERRPQNCAGCGGQYTWLSVDGLCFSCLKKKLAARKRDDEVYGGGFAAEAAEEEDDS
jgi:hypothetical protein